MSSKSRNKSNRQLAAATRRIVAGQPLAESPVVGISSVATSYSGPIPPPSLLEEYNRVIPGSAERIIALYEAQTNHRISLEKKVTNSDIVRSWAGLILGFIVAVMVMSCGTFLAYTNHEWVGGAMSLTGLGSLVGVFVYGSRSQRTERIEKTKIMSGRK